MTLLSALGALWLAGAQPDWTALHEGERRQRVSLPTYPFERKRYWLDTPAIENPLLRCASRSVPDVALSTNCHGEIKPGEGDRSNPSPHGSSGERSKPHSQTSRHARRNLRRPLGNGPLASRRFDHVSRNGFRFTFSDASNSGTTKQIRFEDNLPTAPWRSSARWTRLPDTWTATFLPTHFPNSTRLPKPLSRFLQSRRPPLRRLPPRLISGRYLQPGMEKLLCPNPLSSAYCANSSKP